MMENRNGRDRNNNDVAVLQNGVILRKLKSKHSGECLLCWKEARHPKCLCPKCAKQYCFQCIKKWLTDSKTKTSECPNCKSKLPIDDLVRCAADLVVGDEEDTKQSGHSDNGTNVTECGGNVQQKQQNEHQYRRNGVESGSIKLVVKVIESDSSLDGRLTNGNAGAGMVNGSAQAKMLTVNGRQGKKSKESNRKQQLNNHTVTSNGKVPLSNGVVHNGKEEANNVRVNETDTNELTNKRSNGKDQPINHQRKNGFKKLPTTTTVEVPETVVQSDTKSPEAPLENGHSIHKDTLLCQQNGSDQDSDQPLCALHALPLLFFCLTCKCCICETCGIRDSSHTQHVFKKITAIYDDKLGKIRQEFALVSTYLEEIQQVIQSVEHNIDWVKAAKARKLQELSRLLHSEAECIERQINKKLGVLQDQRDTIANEVFRVTAGYKKLESELNSCPQEELLVKDAEFLKRCSQLIEKPASSFVHQPVPADLECDFIPDFRSMVFVIKDYQAIEPIEECRTSDVLCDVIGFGWRLHAWKSDHLSVTLMMTEGVTGRYEYCIELLHEDDPTKSIRLTQIDHFEHHQTGPVHDLIENERLVEEGFIGDANDTLQIKFSVRPPTIVMKSRYQQEYIDRTRKDNINEYDSNVITICNIRDPTTSIVLSKQYTDTVGSRWRLNVYPKGNNTNYRYLSTYVELCDGIAGRYQYIVELLHNDAHKQVKFQSEDHFRVGEIRGYQKFIRVKRVLEEGYLNDDGSIYIRLSIRPATLALRCQYQEEYQSLKEEKILFQFNSQLSQHLTRIRNLREENTALQSIAYPEYNSNIFVMRNFTGLRQASEDVCSDNSYDDLGCCWRLIVYANGDKEGRDEWLSVYLRLLEGIPGSYEYCIELLHNDPTKTVKMEGTQTFEIQERFGWSQFARLDMICANGFVNEEHDALYFRFSLRPPNYKGKCEYQQLLRMELKKDNELLKRELIPEYSTITYTLKNFTELQRKEGFVYSDPLCDDLGFTWRLLIYANGHSEGLGCNLSVYLVLFDGVSGSRFEYRVELLHRNPTANIKMEGVNVFKLKKIWGWPQYIHHERLRQEGYLNEDDSLEFRLSICPPDIKLKCEYQQEFIRQLKERKK
uniref:E3 ubiquitin-protein ligase TRIM37 n=2 Tax=Culex pipiens TaxID=7175 RepID=A0A8D8F123_CULPI